MGAQAPYKKPYQSLWRASRRRIFGLRLWQTKIPLPIRLPGYRYSL